MNQTCFSYLGTCHDVQEVIRENDELFFVFEFLVGGRHNRGHHTHWHLQQQQQLQWDSSCRGRAYIVCEAREVHILSTWRHKEAAGGVLSIIPMTANSNRQLTQHTLQSMMHS
jgi:hypothetical protein